MRPASLHARPLAASRRLRWLSLVLLPALFLLAAGLAAPAASAQSNLLVNGDFAAGSTTGWTCSPGDTVVTVTRRSGA